MYLHILAPSPQPIIFERIATTSNNTVSTTTVADILLNVTLRPTLAKNTGERRTYETVSKRFSIYEVFLLFERIRPATKAPVISLTPKKYSAANDISKQNANARITKRLKSFLYLLIHGLTNLMKRNATTPQNMKKPSIFRSITHRETSLPAKLEITVSAIIPSTSSISAAPKIALPVFVESLPSSLSVSTVILTDVAVRTTPTNMFCSIVCWSVIGL